jgi:nitroreductase
MSETAYQTMLARRSIRKYSQEPVSEEQIRRLLEAAMAAPSANNLQPWHFMVVTERRLLDALANAHPYGKMLLEAPLCIVVCAEPENAHWVQDCSAATENILLAATEMGLGSVWCGVAPSSQREHDVRDILGIPAHMTPLNLVPIGHPAEQKEPRTQFKAERVHRNAW